MKKIVAAWIEQILEFDSLEESNCYARDLINKGKKFAVMAVDENLPDGHVRVRLRKQYNNNNFPGREET